MEENSITNELALLQVLRLMVEAYHSATPSAQSLLNTYLSHHPVMEIVLRYAKFCLEQRRHKSQGLICVMVLLATMSGLNTQKPEEDLVDFSSDAFVARMLPEWDAALASDKQSCREAKELVGLIKEFYACVGAEYSCVGAECNKLSL